MFGEVRSEKGDPFAEGSIQGELMKRRRKGDITISDISKRERGTVGGFNHKINADDKVALTLVSGGTHCRAFDGLKMTKEDIINVQTFPQDYNFLNLSPQYICGMSVPPVMMAQISTQVKEQWLDLL